MIQQNTSEWEAWRGKGIGASEVWLAVTNPLVPYLRKVEGVRTDEPDTAIARWGHVIEPAILDYVCEVRGWKRSGPVCIEHPATPWHRASLDCIAGSGLDATWSFIRGGSIDAPRDIIGPIDAKNRAFAWRDFGADGDTAEEGKAPMDLRVQVMAQCYVLSGTLGTPIERGYLAVQVGGTPPRLIAVPYDRDLYEGVIVPKIDELWQRILARNPPAPTDSEGAAARWPRAWESDEVLRLDDEHDAAAAEYIAERAAEKEAAERADRAKAKLCEALGEHPKGVTKRFRVAWSNVAGREVVDAKALREANPTVYEQFVRETAGHRAFRVTPITGRK